jgi:subtilase family serine protease
MFLLRIPSYRLAGLALICAGALALGLLALTGPATAQTAGTTPLPGSRPAWVSAARVVGRADGSAGLTTEVYLGGNPAGLAAYARSVSDPGSPDYQRFLSPAAVWRRFGPTPGQVLAVDRWLSASGLKVRRVSLQEIRATGTVAAAERAYGTPLDQYATSAGTFRAPAGEVRAPAGIARDVLSVGGLENMPALMKPASLDNVAGPVRAGTGSTKLPMSLGPDGAIFLGPTPCSAYWGQLTDKADPPINGVHQPYDICGYTPRQLRAAYNLRYQTGNGVTVAITDAYGSATIESDADTYAVNHDGQPFAPGQFAQTVTPARWIDKNACGGTFDWASEETLDVEAVHALAPGADIHYYGANSCNDPQFIAVLAHIIDAHSADVITNSWGGPISALTGNEPASTIAVYTELFEQAAAEGIEVSFSAGDCGAEDPATVCGAADESTQPQADFPSSDPWVTSVGGTAVEIGQRGNARRTVPWGDDVSLLEHGAWVSLATQGYEPRGWVYGGGGGTSGPSTGGTFPGFTQPWYQKGVVPARLAESLPTGRTASRPMRVTPDVALDADPQTGFLVGQTQPLPDGRTGYAEGDVGGTSLASPLFAGLVADGIQSRVLPRGFVNPVLYLDYGIPAGVFRDVITPPAGSAPYTILPPFGGGPAAAVRLGDDDLLVATRGYDDATGVGTPRGVVPGFRYR